MDTLLGHLFLLLLTVVGASCLPRPDLATPSRQSNSSTPSDPQPRSVVKFPHNISSDIVRSPPGGWIRDTRNKESFKNKTRGDLDGSIVFPKDPSESSPDFLPRLGADVPACPDGDKFCDTAQDYPSSYVVSILQNSATEYQALFGNDLVEDNGLSHRIDLPNENPLCESFVEIRYLKKATDKDGDLKYIVNVDDYKQGVRVETCVSEGKSCDFSDSFPLGYKTRCKQKYIYRKMLALSGEKVEPLEFPIPACCTCVVESTPAIRFGTFIEASKTSPKTPVSKRTPKPSSHSNSTTPL